MLGKSKTGLLVQNPSNCERFWFVLADVNAHKEGNTNHTTKKKDKKREMGHKIRCKID